MMGPVTIRESLSYDDFIEAERRLAQAFGLPDSRMSTGQAIGMRLLMWFASRFSKTTMTFDQAGVRNHQREEPWPWSAFGMAYETERLVCLVLTETTAPVTVRKGSCTSTELETIRRLIAARVSSSPEALARIAAIRTSA